MYGVGLQIGGIADALVGNSTSGVYPHVVRIIVGTFEEPHPTWTCTGTTAHLLVTHSLSVNIQVTVTITVWIYGLNSAFILVIFIVWNQFVITVLQIVTVRIRIEELQQVGMVIHSTGVVEAYEVVNRVSDPYVIIFAITTSITLISISSNLCDIVSFIIR